MVGDCRGWLSFRMELMSHHFPSGEIGRRSRRLPRSSRSFCFSGGSAGKRDSIGFCAPSRARKQGNSPSWATDDEGLAPQLVKLAEGLGITDRIRILPRTVIGCEKERLFSAARIFVLASYSENFGNTVLEAMRRRVPVVVTPEVGAAQIVRESGAGLVVAGDPISLSTAICQLTSDGDLARSMGEAGQRHAVAHHSWANIAARMEQSYESLRL